MCQHTNRRHSIFCILPPHVLHSIAEKGSPEHRVIALNVLGHDQTYRTLRAIRLAAPVIGAPAVALAATTGKQRTIYDARTSQNLPGAVVRHEGGAATGDPAADEAYDGLGATYDLYSDLFQRNSIDNN